MFRDAVQDVQRIDSNVGLRVGEPNESVVQENIKPLLVELLLLSNKVSLTGIHDLVICNIVLKVLHNLDPLI